MIQILKDDFKGFKTSVGNIITDVEIAGELEVDPEDVTELLILLIKLECVRSCFL